MTLPPTPLQRAASLATFAFLLTSILACPLEATANSLDEQSDQPSKAAAPASNSQTFYQQLRHVTVEVLVNGRISGMGTFVKTDGLIISAGHLFEKPGQRIEILSTAIGRHEAQIIAIDRGHDLALLRVTLNEGEKTLSTPAVELAESMPKAPEQIYQFGAPVCRRGVLQTGTIARDETTFEYLGDQKASVEVIHVCATAQQGTSGGPWLDRQGRLLGVQSATMMVGGSPAGVAFVSPLSSIKNLLKTQKTASTPTLGVAVEELWQQSSDFIQRFPQGTEGIVLKVLHKDGPADRADLKKMDMVTHVDGKRVRWISDFLKAVRLHKPGEKVELELMLPDGAGTEKVHVPAAHLEIAWVKANG